MLAVLAGDRQADRVVPPTGFTARLTIFTAGAMAQRYLELYRQATKNE
jgi:cell division transport system permease protein